MTAITGLFILFCWIVFLVYITITAFSVKRTTEVKKGWNWSWLLLALFVGALFPLLKYIPPQAHTLVAEIIGDVLVLLGLIIALRGRMMLGRNWNIYPGLKKDHELIERGPYAYVRHPMYSGLLLMLLGILIWYGSSIGIIIFISCFFGTWFKLRQEEKLLTEHFGEKYQGYKKRVKALIPFVW